MRTTWAVADPEGHVEGQAVVTFIGPYPPGAILEVNLQLQATPTLKASTLELHLHTPEDYMCGVTHTTGILLIAGTNAGEIKGPLYMELASACVEQGALVARCHVGKTDALKREGLVRLVRSLRHCPYARHVKQWLVVLQGLGCSLLMPMLQQLQERNEVLVGGLLLLGPPCGGMEREDEAAIASLVSPLQCLPQIPRLLVHGDKDASIHVAVLDRLAAMDDVYHTTVPNLDASFKLPKVLQEESTAPAVLAARAVAFLHLLDKKEGGEIKLLRNQLDALRAHQAALLAAQDEGDDDVGGGMEQEQE